MKELSTYGFIHIVKSDGVEANINFNKILNFENGKLIFSKYSLSVKESEEVISEKINEAVAKLASLDTMGFTNAND